MQTTRRRLLRNLALAGVGFAGLQACASRPDSPLFGDPDLIPDSNGVLDLPDGFRYAILSRTGERMNDGLLVPSRHDGMGAFPAPDGRVFLIRNHELGVSPFDESAFAGRRGLETVDPSRLYDAGHGHTPGLGGTTSLIYDPGQQRVERQYLSLAGTYRNCAGGVTPWLSWISCEEYVGSVGGPREKNHGYCFEVPRTFEMGLVEPLPLRAMGRFNHEAVAVDPQSGVVYLTEDRSDGLFYRFLPETLGKLCAGGRLQALKISETGLMDTRNWKRVALRAGEGITVEWVDLAVVDGADDDLRYRGAAESGAALFARAEGIWFGWGEAYLACTSGGSARQGQLWRYRPSPLEGRPEERHEPARLELLAEPESGALLHRPDNLTVTPWGELLVCEDSQGVDRLIRIDREGGAHLFARNAMNASELAGATFSVDGQTLFLNIQVPGLTLAITGPWPKPVTVPGV